MARRGRRKVRHSNASRSRENDASESTPFLSRESSEAREPPARSSGTKLASVALLLFVGGALAVLAWLVRWEALGSSDGAFDVNNRDQFDWSDLLDPKFPTLTFRATSARSWNRPSEMFTQGFEFDDEDSELVWHSTGLNGRSEIATHRLTEAGQVESERELATLPQKYFGEGVTLLRDSDGRRFAYWLTWQSGDVFQYEVMSHKSEKTGQVSHSLSLVKQHKIPGQGWGISQLSNDSSHVILTDGSHLLFTYSLSPWELRKQQAVFEVNVEGKKRKISRLNEIESTHNSLLLSNVWFDTRIAVVHPATGKVIAWLECRDLFPSGISTRTHDKVLNGIAIDTRGRILVTGKRWPVIHELQFGENDDFVRRLLRAPLPHEI
ncbi:MAG: hypothetical protein MHM6MM_005186 [Cercozoa sp. M6MM]